MGAKGAAAAGAAAKARIRGRAGREAGRRAAVAAGAAARANGAGSAAASETARRAAARRRRRRTPTARSPGHSRAQCQRSENTPRLSLARGKAKGSVRVPSPIWRPDPDQGPIPNQNQTPRQNHAPDQSRLQKPSLGLSLDPGLLPDRPPGLDLGPIQGPNWLRPWLELPTKSFVHVW